MTECNHNSPAIRSKHHVGTTSSAKAFGKLKHVPPRPVAGTVERNLPVIISEGHPFSIRRFRNSHTCAHSFVRVHQDSGEDFLRIDVTDKCRVTPAGVIVAGVNEESVCRIKCHICYVVCCKDAADLFTSFDSPQLHLLIVTSRQQQFPVGGSRE